MYQGQSYKDTEMIEDTDHKTSNTNIELDEI